MINLVSILILMITMFGCEPVWADSCRRCPSIDTKDIYECTGIPCPGEPELPAKTDCQQIHFQFDSRYQVNVIKENCQRVNAIIEYLKAQEKK